MIKTLLALVLALPFTAQHRDAISDTTRARMDLREIAGVVPHETAVDVYWVRTNELVEPVTSKLMRTVVSAEGSRISTTTIRTFPSSTGVRVAGEGANVQVLWTSDSTLVASPLLGDALQYPEGKLIASFAQYPRLVCSSSECAAIYGLAGEMRAVFVDGDSNVTGEAISLPNGFFPINVVLEERGIFYVRHDLNAIRAALVRCDGTVQYDVAIAAADPLAFHAGPIAIATNTVAFVEYAPDPDEIRAVKISENGAVSDSVKLAEIKPFADLANNVGALSLARTGSKYVLGVGYIQGVPLLRQYDPALQLIEEKRSSGGAVPSAVPFVGSAIFAIVWNAPTPYVTVLFEDGTMSAPIALEATPRRRSVR